jgi:hypothetical protein
MKPQYPESTQSNPNKMKGVAAATGLAIALGAGVVGAALSVEKPKETKVETISQADKSALEITTTSTEAPTTTVAVEQKDIQVTPTTVAMPEVTSSTTAPTVSKTKPTISVTPTTITHEDPYLPPTEGSNDYPKTEDYQMPPPNTNTDTTTTIPAEGTPGSDLPRTS